MSVAGRSTIGSPFWQQQARRFADLRQQDVRQSKRPLGASYYPGGWGLDSFGAFRGRTCDAWLLDNGTRPVIEDFKSIASVCAVAIGSPNSDTAWIEWLDCLRRESVDFKPGEMSSNSWARDWRPTPDFEVVNSGLMWPPVEVRPDPDPVLVSTDIGEIEDVCVASERVCRRLADDALKVEMTEASPVIVDGAQASEGVSPQVPDPTKTMTLKEAAAKLRVSIDTLDRMRNKGQIKMFRVGSRWRVKASEVIRLREQPSFDSHHRELRRKRPQTAANRRKRPQN